MNNTISPTSVKNPYKDSIAVVVLYFLTILVTYQLGPFFKEILFVIYFVIFLFSRNDVVWLSFFIILRFSPGFLFSEYDIGHELPNYFASRIQFTDAVVLIILFKALATKVKNKVHIDFPIIVFIIYATFLFFISFTEGLSLIKGFRAVKFLLHFTMFFSVPVLLDRYENYLRVMNIFLVFSGFIFLSQIYLLVNVQHINNLFGGSLQMEGSDVAVSQYENVSIIRPLYSGHLLLLNLFSYLWYSSSRLKITEAYRLKMIDIFGFISYLALVLSATRGYILAATILMIGILYFNTRYRISKAVKSLGIVLLFLLFVLSSDIVSDQLGKSLFRLTSISQLIEGDETAGGTLVRITKRLPVVVDKFYERPILGWGFSDEFFEYFDGHVAWATILMSGGLIGGIIAALFTFYLIFDPIRMYNRTRRKEFLSFCLIFTAFVSLQTTTFLVFHFLVGITVTFIIFFLLTFYLKYKSSYLLLDGEKKNAI